VVEARDLLLTRFGCCRFLAPSFNDWKAPDLFGMTVARMARVGATPYTKLEEEKAFLCAHHSENITKDLRPELD
jgi:hypothetical protein